MSDQPVRTIDQISDSELEDCYDGTTDNHMVRRLIGECSNEDGWIDSEDFGYLFARQIEGFIDADEDSEEWEEAWDANREWGENIAQNVNDAMAKEEPEEYKE